MALQWLSGVATAAVMIALAVTPAAAQPAVTFPILMPDAKPLATFGISMPDGTEALDTAKRYPVHCYTQEGFGYGISVSTELMARYKVKGFSRHSLCLGLLSEARYNPETGARLPTYLIVDEAELKKALKGRNPKTMTTKQLENCCGEQYTGNELPLVVPDCFKNGAPYSDCNWRFDLKTGAALTPATTQRYREFGLALERGMARILSGTVKGCPFKRTNHTALTGWPTWPCNPQTIETSDTGFLRPEYDSVIDAVRTHAGREFLAKDLTRGTLTQFLDVSAAFTRGFGYALNALYCHECGGPSVAPAYLLRYIFDTPTRASSINLQDLKKRYDD